MSIVDRIEEIKKEIPESTNLIAVSKYHPTEDILTAYESGHRIFGESKAQELITKYEVLPKDIEWHFIGHLQRNKVKYIAPFIHSIHSIDSYKLLETVNREAKKNNRIIRCLLQIHIADEETKYGFTFQDCRDMLSQNHWKDLQNIKIVGLMGMATNTDIQADIKAEFTSIKQFHDELKQNYFADNVDFKELSIGMSDDYPIAVTEGSTYIRVGSKIFGERIY